MFVPSSIFSRNPKLTLFAALTLLLLTLAAPFPAAAQGQPGACSGFTTQLTVGKQGHVTPGQANNVRPNPGTAGGNSPIGQMPGNSLFMVIGGPRCADNFTWWQVNFNGLVGWTAEGNSGQRWLDANTSTSSTPRTPVNGLQGTSAQTLFVNIICTLQDGQPVGRSPNQSDYDLVYNGQTVIFAISAENDYSDAPDVCVPDTLADSTFAVSPFGAVVPTIVKNDFLDIKKVQLPLWAFSQPGVWQLGAGDFSIYIDVQLAYQPVFETAGGEVLLGGFSPEESVALVYGLSTSVGSFTVALDNLSALQVITDSNGYFSGSFDLGGNRYVAAVGSSGTIIRAPGLASLQTANMDEFAVNGALYDAFFGSSTPPTPVISEGGGSAAWSGPNEVGTGWDSFLDVFGADDGVIYGIAPNGDLLWYYHYGYTDGSISWAGPNSVGTYWDGLLFAFASDNGVIYGITPDTGDLWWYRHDGRYEGSEAWAGVYPVSSGGWNQFLNVFAGDNGSIYAVTYDGDLLWYQHVGYIDGTYDIVGPITVGNGGWADFQTVFAGEGGVIYGIYSNGELYRYVHYGYIDGSANWSERQLIGTGWDSFAKVFAGEGNVVYGIGYDGRLLWYRYEGG